MKSGNEPRITLSAEVINDLYEINRRLCYQLWYIADANSKPRGLSPRLILPQKRDKEIRISEQESKILYCGLLNTLNYYYSIETPTEKGYQQTGKTPKSARTDLSLYVFPEGKNNAQKVANVEFKAHNPEREFIRKDVEKIIKEGIGGNWVHTLKNVDSGTFDPLFKKFIESFRQYVEEAKDGVSILFCFCILEKKWAFIKHFNHKGSKGFEKYVEEFFNYNVSSAKRETVQEEMKKNDWVFINPAADILAAVIEKDN